MDMTKINIAQIGVGYWGPNLLRNLISNQRCDVAAVVDLSPERRQFVKKMYPAVKATDSVDEVLQDSSINAVVISTPVASHFDLAMKALSAGKHILVEKPLTRSVEEADQIGELAKKNGLVAMVGHTFLFNPAVRYVKKLVDNGDLGDLRYIYCQRLNLGRIRSDVDALWNFAPHDVSIIQYWLGDAEPISVSRQGMDYVQSGVQDVVFMNIVYPSKVMAHVHVSWLDPHKVRCITVVGSKKMVVYDDVAENKIAIFDKGIDRKAELGKGMDFDNPSFPQFSHRSGDVLIPQIKAEEPLAVEIDHFIDCISKGTPCLTGSAHARGVIKILSLGKTS